MAGQKYTLKFITDLDLSNMKQGLNQFQDQLNKLGAPKSLSKSLNSTIESLKSEMKSIESLTSKEFISKSDMNSLISSYDKIDKLIRKINVDSKELNNLSLDKLLPAEQLNRFNKLESILKKLQPLLNLKATIPEEIGRLGDKAKTSQSNIEKLNKELKELEDKRSRNIEDQTNARTKTQELKTRKNTLEKEQEKLRSKPRGVQSEEYISLQKRIKDTRTQVTLLEQDLQKKEAQLKKVESTRTKNSEVKKANVEIAESNVAKAETKLNAEREKLQEMENRARSLRGQKTDGTQLKAYKDNEEALKKLNKEIEESESKEKELSEKNKETAAAIVDKTNEIKKEQKELEKTNEKIKQLQESGNVDQSKIDEIKKDIEELTGIKIETNDLEELKEIIDNLKSDTIKETSEELDQFNEIQSEVEKNAEEVSDSLNEETKAWEIFDSKQKEVNGIKTRIASFFALDNAIQLVKRTMRSAYETIKELDKAMTETAVVTDFSVGDMWAQLPDYTKRANELGVSTKAAYEAATLYYQQGLKTNEVMAMSNETLKMARIAGLDAAVATDRMTNAIRGFNMEINTTNAQRIDDVYSRLAAISASNVDEISTAMTKVASLAHSANMEFETTAAFLAQIIETTRESAETAGTALKTVVARFSEVKKLVSEGELSGSDEEGELIDVNKVSSALRVAGIDLNKYFLGQVGLDDIFMELASKWNQLTTLQQRYIATQAAGSRQQSRFIALMSDYARTQELVGEAYKANGAAAKQFAKTQESLESKLARLKNAWNEFAMGVLNSDIIKWGVDRLTDILNGINALTSGFGTLNSGAGKFLNTFAKLTLLMGGLRVGKGLTGGLFGSIGAMVAGNYEKGMFQQYVAKTLEVDPGKNLLDTLQKGIAGQFSGIGKTVGAMAKKPWGLAQKLGTAVTAPFGIGTGEAALTASGGMSWLAGGGLTGTAAGIVGLTTALAGVAAAAGTAYIAIKKLYDASPAGQIKIAEKYAASLSEVADAARSSQREIESIQEEYNRLETNVQQATTAEEKIEAIKSRTEYIQSLLEQNSAYAQYIDQYEVKNGEIYLTLDSDKLAEACNKIAETALKVQSGADIANANVAFQRYQEAQNDIAKLEMQKVLIEAEQPANQTEAEEKEWRESSGLNQIETSLIQATNRMLQFQQEYQNFATSGTIKNIQNNENLDDVAKSAIANALSYAFNGDEVQKILVDNTTDLFGLIPDTIFHTLKGARQRWIDTFGTTDIPDDIKDNEEALINAVAQEKARQELEKKGNELVNLYSNLTDEQKKIFTDLINNGGENLNYELTTAIKNGLPQLLRLFEEGSQEAGYWAEFWNKLSTELQNILISNAIKANPKQIAEDIISKTFNPGDIRDNLIGLLNTYIENFDLTSKQTEAISKVFTDFAKDNYNSLEPFNEFINNLITTVTNTKDPEIISSFFDALATLDTDSASNINTFFDLLDGLGINFYNVEGSAEAAADKLKELANVKDPFNTEELSAKVSDAVSTIWDIRERKPTQQGYRTFSESEYKIIEDAVKALGPKIDINLDDIFKRTGIKNKEWNYVGGDLEELVQLLIQDLNKAIQQAEDYISAPEWLQKYSDFATKETITIKDNGETQNFTLEEAFREIISNPDFIEKLQNQNPEQFESIIQLLRDMGYTWSETLTKEGLIEIISEALTNYDQFLANKETQPEIDRAVQSVDYLTPINELHQRPGMDFDRYQSAVEGKFAVDEHAEDRYEDILKSIQGLSAAYKQLGIDEKEQEVIAKALAVNWSQQAARLAELTEVLDKNDKILYEGSKDSYEYSGAIHAVGEAMRAAYGEQVTDEFVQAHIQQIVMARESEEAYQELLNLLQQDFFSNAIAGAQGFEGELWRLQDVILQCGATANQLDGLELNGVAILDDTPWMDVIKKLWGNLETFEAYLATCGWTLVLSEERDPSTGLPLHASLVRNQPTGYGGYQPYTGSNWGRGSSGSGSSSKEREPRKEEWKSDFDWLYNLMEDIAELQREQTKLQEEQNKILESNNKEDTGKDLYENLVKQIANLTIQKDYQSAVQGYRRREMQEFMAVNSGYGGYFRFNDQDQTLEIDWDAINNIGDKETYEKVKELVSEAEAIQKKMDESDDAVRDIETQIRQLENIWREQYVSFEKRVLDALVSSYQRVIDNYSDLNDTVTQSNNEILEALQQEISLERQIRDNTETEDAIADAEARLAFLRRDTTGGNQVAILSAQKQLDVSRQQYEDALIDQAISRLQEDNDDAAEQREKQIELMQAQLNYSKENGEFNDKISELIADALGGNGELLTNSDLYDLLRQEEAWDALSEANKEIWEDELNNTFKEVSAYLLKEKSQADGSFAAAIQSSIENSAIQLGNAIIGSVSQAMQHTNYIYDDSGSNYNQDYQPAYDQPNYGTSQQEPTPTYGLQTYGGSGYTVTENGKPIPTAHQGGSYSEVSEDLKKLRGYKTGGLTTKTGLAWLDGTPSEPEYVLNARQTDAFLRLADVLPSIFDKGSTIANNTSNNMYLDFHVNVENISDDYDVDQLVERVKEDIYNAASYRNVNVVNFLR